MTERIKVLQEEGEGFESNVSGFIRDFWLYESKNKFNELTRKKIDKVRGEEVSACPVSSKTLTIMGGVLVV